jgi:hypothetical protein
MNFARPPFARTLEGTVNPLVGCDDRTISISLLMET